MQIVNSYINKYGIPDKLYAFTRATLGVLTFKKSEVYRIFLNFIIRLLQSIVVNVRLDRNGIIDLLKLCYR